jgi:tryptophan synthase alpha chain
MKNRITNLFESKKDNILSVFYTAGFPTLESTSIVAESLANAGADIIEIGIPIQIHRRRSNDSGKQQQWP